jgi:hypothetical protein
MTLQAVFGSQNAVQVAEPGQSTSQSPAHVTTQSPDPVHATLEP